MEAMLLIVSVHSLDSAGKIVKYIHHPLPFQIIQQILTARVDHATLYHSMSDIPKSFTDFMLYNEHCIYLIWIGKGSTNYIVGFCLFVCLFVYLFIAIQSGQLFVFDQIAHFPHFTCPGWSCRCKLCPTNDRI